MKVTKVFARTAPSNLTHPDTMYSEARSQLGKAIDLMASLFRAAKSTQFVYTPNNASRMQDPNFNLELIKAYQQSSYDGDEGKACKTCKALKETFGDIPTFAALQRKQLQFEGDQRRFNRCLAFHASQSRHSALSQAWALRLHQPISYTRDKCERLEPQQLFGAYQTQDDLADPEFQY
ncbi:MAG: hypothetical protein FRX49_07152 [Trebouxia sp. A1-2]|nr:MAG: hypothetical protein FRX49_07152 [Trebouxia sp. A1-2]